MNERERERDLSMVISSSVLQERTDLTQWVIDLNNEGLKHTHTHTHTNIHTHKHTCANTNFRFLIVELMLFEHCLSFSDAVTSIPLYPSSTTYK